MQPGQLHLNELERAILDRLASKEPALREVAGQLHVLSREFTGVGSFTNFACDESSADAPEKRIGLDEVIAMPGVPNGMGAVLFCKGDSPTCLEVFTYGDDCWQGDYEGFTIDDRA